MRCHNCGFTNDADAGFCQNCGTALARACANCGAPLKLGAKFCIKCGTPVASSTRGIVSAVQSADRLAAPQKSTPHALQENILATRAQLEGKRKPVTILFTDIVGSTSLAEKLDPEEWKEIVSGAHQRVSDAVYRYEGTIAQLLGDGVLAFFGAPITHEDDAARAVRAALEIQQRITAYADELRGYVGDFQMRVGLNTGLVVVGAVGSDLHMEYLAIGDAVNLAARLQSAAQPGKVLISDTTAKLVRAAFELRDLGTIAVKGKAAPVAVFEVVEAKALPESGRGIAGLSSPLVGRDRELGQLRSALAALFDGQGQIVSVIGEAGIGKSRLIEECRKEQRAVHWLEGRALSYGESLSFWTIMQLLKADLKLADGDPEPRMRVALRRRVNSLFGDRENDVLPYLAHLLGLKLEGESAERVKMLDGETLKRQVLLSINEYFIRLAQECPTVLVFEDFHWADPSTLDVIQRLLHATRRARLMLLFVTRQEPDQAPWRIVELAAHECGERYTEIKLAPLSPDCSNELINNLLEIAELPETTRRLMLERSEGNPFYLEEIIRSLIEQGGVVRDDDGHWRAQSLISNLQIPDTLQGVLLARMDRLAEEVRRTLQLASVVGKSFLYRLLEAIAEVERELDWHLALLERADLVREKTRQPELEYIFKHSLTQQAAYDSLLIERRREFHHKVGVALEQLFADRREEFCGLLAHHFDAAGEREKAIEYLLQAGDKTRLEDAHVEAIRYYRRAIELLTDLGEGARAARTWLKLGLVHSANFDFAAAHQAYEMAFALRQKLPSVSSLALPASKDQQPNVVRFLLPYDFRRSLVDPGKITYSAPFWFASHVFSGLAEMDLELNVVPQVARSWQVLDEGRRYVFHLRDDVRWTDGTMVTAADFEWTWKRNLMPTTQSLAASFLDDIVGARDFREGRVSNPDSVGVKALDPWTLEVRLIAPTAYFPYIFTLPITWPLPRTLIERYGDEWCKADPLISNGAFRWTASSPTQRTFERNLDFFGEFPGNVDQVQFLSIPDHAERWRAFAEGRGDISRVRPGDLSPELAPRAVEPWRLFTLRLIFKPTRSPLDDIRVRRALMYALDRERIAAQMNASPARGGLIPPGMPGHSPDLALGYDPAGARQLLAQAGFPEGRDLPHLVLRSQSHLPFEEIVRQWQDTLGVRVDWIEEHLRTPDENAPSIQLGGWVADYPDPHNFLHDSVFPFYPGGLDPSLKALIEDAARVHDRAQRMAMYREADRRLVLEQAIILPLTYGERTTIWITKPWVKNFPVSAIGELSSKYITVEPHEEQRE